jgi:hypothetical protein
MITSASPSFRNWASYPVNMVLALVLVCSIFIVAPAQAKDYDLVILNGQVMDPQSGLDEIRNVGITDGKIAAVTKKSIKGRQKIDASGHLVAPGFIDGHVHTVDIPLGQKALQRNRWH